MNYNPEWLGIEGGGDEREDIVKRLRFCMEMDKMKSVYRQSLIADRSRTETDAEHSFQLAIMAVTLLPMAKDKDMLDMKKVLEMCLVHDLVEIDAGDTFAYDETANQSKAERELNAAERIFSIQPGAEGARFRALWEEFDLMQSPEARYANAVDRLQPILQHVLTDGIRWHNMGVKLSQLETRMIPIYEALPSLAPVLDAIKAKALGDGLIKVEG